MPYFQFLFRGANAHFIYFRILVQPKRVCCRCIAFLSHRQSAQYKAALRTASLEFQSPNMS